LFKNTFRDTSLSFRDNCEGARAKDSKRANDLLAVLTSAYARAGFVRNRKKPESGGAANSTPAFSGEQKPILDAVVFLSLYLFSLSPPTRGLGNPLWR